MGLIMKTRRELSFISWNSQEFLTKKLDNLIDNGTISFYFFVPHYAEKDETKNHTHVYFVPDGTVDTVSLREHFTEFDPAKPSKPIRPADFHPSKFGDAYFYFLHDPDYLASKGQSREYIYQDSDIVTNDFDVLKEMLHRVDVSKIKGNKIKMIQEAHEHGVSFKQLLSSGRIPIQQIAQYEKAYQLMGLKVERNGRVGHDVAVGYDDAKTLDQQIYEEFGILLPGYKDVDGKLTKI